MNGWRPTPDQKRIARWAAFSVGYAAPHIGTDDLQQVAMLAIWQARQQAAREDGSVVPDNVVARSACLSYLQRTLGHTGTPKRVTARRTVPLDDVHEPSLPALSTICWETPDLILEAKQTLAGFYGQRDLHAEVLAELIDGNMTRLEIAAKHGTTVRVVNKISELARMVLAHGAPIRRCEIARVRSKLRPGRTQAMQAPAAGHPGRRTGDLNRRQ